MQALKNKVSQDLPTSQQSLTYIRNLLRTAISSICYLRGLFDETYFVDKNLCGINIKALSPVSEHAKVLTQWIEHGVFDALQKKCLKTMIFGICLDPNNEASILESYHFAITYPSPNEIGLIVGEDGTESIVPSKDNIKYATTTLLRRLICLTQTFQELPSQRHILMKLNYYKDRIPQGYSPQFFTTVEKELKQEDENGNEVTIGDIVTPYHGLRVFSNEPIHDSNKEVSQVMLQDDEETYISQSMPNSIAKDEVPYDSQETYMDDYSQMSQGSRLSRKRGFSEYDTGGISQNHRYI